MNVRKALADRVHKWLRRVDRGHRIGSEKLDELSGQCAGSTADIEGSPTRDHAGQVANCAASGSENRPMNRPYASAATSKFTRPPYSASEPKLILELVERHAVEALTNSRNDSDGPVGCYGATSSRPGIPRSDRPAIRCWP